MDGIDACEWAEFMNQETVRWTAAGTAPTEVDSNTGEKRGVQISADFAQEKAPVTTDRAGAGTSIR